jgi:hypothetical protein
LEPIVLLATPMAVPAMLVVVEAPLADPVEAELRVWLVRVEFTAVAEFERAPNPVTPSPFLLPPNQFTPRSRPALRSTSRMRTFSITCCDGEIFIALMTGAFGERPLAQ